MKSGFGKGERRRNRATGRFWPERLMVAGLLSILLLTPGDGQETPQPASGPYPWLALRRVEPEQALAARIPASAGYHRLHLPPDSFGTWLRGLPLLPGRPLVRLYNGKAKSNQSVHVAVVDMDTGRRDLQQCADAIIRLRAEYLYARQDWEAIQFNFTSGFRAGFHRWAEGDRIVFNQGKAAWRNRSGSDYSYLNFRDFLEQVFIYAGTLSLSKEMQPLPVTDLQPGDVLVQGGAPGHAVLIMDAAEDSTGRRVFLLAQSYMPAQQVHILKNPSDEALSPWYRIEAGRPVPTPEWRFPPGSQKRFPG